MSKDQIAGIALFQNKNTDLLTWKIGKWWECFKTTPFDATENAVTIKSRVSPSKMPVKADNCVNFDIFRCDKQEVNCRPSYNFIHFCTKKDPPFRARLPQFSIAHHAKRRPHLGYVSVGISSAIQNLALLKEPTYSNRSRRESKNHSFI